MTIRSIAMSLFVAFLIVGCSGNKLHEEDFVYTVTLNGYVYGLSDEVVPNADVADRIEGTGVISCKYSECPAPLARNFFTIKDVPASKAIAREEEINNHEAVYRKCVMIRKA